MILRKPFAILIKHFKLIHVILMLLMIYVLSSTNSILSFLNEYIGSTTFLITHEVVQTLFKSTLNISIFFILLISIIILVLMTFKRKPVKFYLINLAVYIYTFVILLVAKNNISTLEVSLLDVRTLKMVQDLLVSTIFIQAVSLLYVAIRATGFDIKKFNFVADLEELDINTEDNEEFEVNFDVDTDKYLRRFRKIIRYIKYLYAENKYIFNIGISLFVALICFLIYLNLNVYNKTFTENSAFKTNEFMINIKNCYLTKNDYYGNTIDDNYQFVVVPFSIRQFTTRDKTMKDVTLALDINDHRFYHTLDYKTEFNDLGNLYKEENITTDFTDYIMVYKIPNSYIDDEMNLKFYDNNRKVVTIRIKPRNLNDEQIVGNYKITDEVDLKDSVLKNSIFSIESYEISEVFRETYNFCASDNCYESVEYVRANLDSNDRKDLLKLTGNIQLDEKLPINKIDTLYIFIKKFGKLTYVKDGVMKKISLNLPQVKPVKVYDKMKTYIEVPKELQSAEKIILNIEIRNKVYNYVLK